MALDSIFLIVIQNFVAIRSIVLEKMTLEVAILVIFQLIFRTEIVTSSLCYGEPDVTLNGCTSCRVTVLVNTLLVNVKRETQFWIAITALSIFANHNEI